jgi:hypothetical protein
MKNVKARCFCTLAAVSIVLTSSWLAGFNFDSRGPGAFSVFLITLAAAVVGATCPFFDP